MGTIFKVELHAKALGQNVDNVFHYFSFNPGVLEGLVAAFAAVVLPRIQGIVSEQTQFRYIRGTDVREPQALEITYQLNDFTGTRTGAISPSFSAWGYQMTRVAGPVRSGGKRFGVMVESDTNGNVESDFFTNNLENLELALGAVFDVGGHEVIPIVYRKPDSAEDPAERTTQVKYGTYKRLTTQKSRQQGRGNDSIDNLAADVKLNEVDNILDPNTKWSTFSQWVTDGGKPITTVTINGVDTVTELL